MIELNADIGEGCDDASLLPYLDRVSIACGGHAGDAASMAAALRLAAEHGVAAGAHPSYPDRAQFGRQALAASADDIAAWVTQQTEALAEQAARLGLSLAHVKPHGALYNVAARDADVAQAIARATTTSRAATLYSAPCGLTCASRSPSRAACSASSSVCCVTQATISSADAASSRRPNCARSG